MFDVIFVSTLNHIVKSLFVLVSFRSFSTPSPSACRIFLMAAWTRCSAQAPVIQNTPSTRCVCVRAESSTCPPRTAPPPARPPTVCVYGAESGVGASPDTRKAFLLFLLPSFLPHPVYSSAIFTSTAPLSEFYQIAHWRCDLD